MAYNNRIEVGKRRKELTWSWVQMRRRMHESVFWVAGDHGWRRTP
jgi:hypothetical protein